MHVLNINGGYINNNTLLSTEHWGGGGLFCADGSSLYLKHALITNNSADGLDNLAAAIGEERETIEDVLEPYLIQQGFLQRTPRGRMATTRAWNHFGITPPEMP